MNDCDMEWESGSLKSSRGASSRRQDQERGLPSARFHREGLAHFRPQELYSGAERVAQLVEGMYSMLETPDSIHVNQAWWCRPVILALERWRQEDSRSFYIRLQV